MRRRTIHPLVASIVIGCGGPPDATPGAEAPADQTAAEPVIASDTSASADTMADATDAPDSPAADTGSGGGQPAVDTDDAADPWSDARMRGIDFRAIGQEPGWFLEIDDAASILFAYDYGTERTSVQTPEPYIDEDTGRKTYRAAVGAEELVVVIDAEPCFDTMSGEAFDRVVTVSLGAREYRGCGRVP